MVDRLKIIGIILVLSVLTSRLWVSPSQVDTGLLVMGAGALILAGCIQLPESIRRWKHGEDDE